MAIFMILVLGTISIISIPKESNPDIKFGIINIATVYPGVSPIDVDQLITQEIEQKIKDVTGIKKITSSSSVWISNVTVELESSADVKTVLWKIKDEVDKADLPQDAEDPFVLEISTDSQVMFDLIVYGKSSVTSPTSLKQLARSIKNKLTGYGSISSINIWWGDDLDVQLIVQKGKMEQMWISLAQIMSTIRAFNQNIPLGNFTVGDLNYDFRIHGELGNVYDLLDLDVIGTKEEVQLKDIATLAFKYKDGAIRTFGRWSEKGYYSVSLTFNKQAGESIFSTSAEAKKAIEELFKTQEFANVKYTYTNDLSETIGEDYNTLAHNARETFVLVFLFTVLFLTVKESAIAAFSVPLAFLVTIFILDKIGSSLNFMTNFSLVLTFGIAIDVAVVVVQSAGINMKLGYDPKNAALLAVREYYKPLISGTVATAIVFVPMMFLPGIVGKFLAYIPITIFTALMAALFISLTLNSALLYKFNKRSKVYHINPDAEKFLSPENKAILEEDRKTKTPLGEEQLSFRQRFLDKMSNGYGNFLRRFLKSGFLRRASVIVPVCLLIGSFIFFHIWFTLFPQSDNGFFWVTVAGKEWSITQVMQQYIPLIEKVVSSMPEVKQYTTTTNENNISINIDLLNKKDRKKEHLRDVFAVESEVLKLLKPLEEAGLKVSSQVEWGGPPPAKPIWLKLITDDSEQFAQLLVIANDFEQYLRSLDGTKNVAVSSQPSPGQFTYELNKNKLRSLGLAPSDLVGEIAAAMNGFNAGTIRIQKEERTIKVLYDEFVDKVSPSAIQDMIIPTRVGPVVVGEVIDYKLENAVSQIAREDTKIAVRVDADLAEWREWRGAELQAKYLARAQVYSFPDWFSFNSAGEQEGNAELISATGQWFFIAIFCIFIILVLQFNSFRKPVVILYSVVVALLWVNIWFLITGNLYSMAFAIGFIALTGIVINHAIIVIDRIHENISRDIDHFEAIIEAGKSRLQPMIITTLNTIVGVLPITFQDKFWEGIGITLIFWLFVGTIMTLFVIPSLYYIVFISPKKLLKERAERKAAAVV